MRSFKFGEILGVLWGRDLRWWGLEGGGGELKGSGGRGVWWGVERQWGEGEGERNLWV